MSYSNSFSGVALGVCWALVVTFSPHAAADMIHLTNGDRLTGTVSRVESGTLVFTTDYAGELTIPLEHIQALETDEPVAVRMEGGEPEMGRIVADEDTLSLKSDAGVKAIAPGAITTLAPTLEALTAQEEALAKAAEDAKPKKWSGKAELGMAWRSGERDTFDANTAITLSRKWELHTLTGKLTGAYGEADSTLNTQKSKGELKWRYQPKGPLYYFTIASLEHDEGRQLELRGAFGGGLGYDVIKNERRTLSAELGAEYSYERWENFARGERRGLIAARRMVATDGLLALGTSIATGNQAFNLRTALEGGLFLYDIRNPDLRDPIRTEDDISLRLSAHYEQTIFKRSKIMNDLLLLPQVDNPADFRLTNDLAFSTPISESLSLRISLHTEYDNDPGTSGIDKFDNTFLTGLQYEF